MKELGDLKHLTMHDVFPVSIDHFPKSCGPPEYHLRSIKRLKKKKKYAPSRHLRDRVYGSGVGVEGLWFMVWGWGFRVQGSGFRVSAFGFKV